MDIRTHCRGRLTLVVLSALIAAFSLALLILIAPYQNTNKTTAPDILFVGTYQTPTMAAPLPLEKGGAPNTFWNPEVTFQGHFDRPLLKGSQLFFLMEYLEVRISLDGEEIFSFGTESDYPRVARSAGMSWGHSVLPRDVDQQDQFTITLRSKYQNNYYSAYNDFVDSLCTGDSGALARRILGESWLFIVLSVSFAATSLLILVFGLLLGIQKIHVHPSVYRFACFALTVSFWCFIDPRYSSLLIGNTILITQLETFCLLLSAALLPAYLGTFLKTKARRINGILLYLVLLLSAATLALQLMGLTDGYAVRTSLIIALGGLTLVCAGNIFYEMRHNPRHEFRLLVAPGLIFLFCALLEFINYGLELFLPSKVLFLGFFVLMAAQLILAVRYIKNALLLGRRAAELEKQLTESRISTMLSQIQPHFLYNALDCIGELCVVDPIQAEQAVTEFSMFLRGNIDSLSAPGTIPFGQELSHTRHYLELEQMRFGARLKVVYQIEDSLFRLPPLTLQPIVENAVRYGVMPREEGGTVTISTASTPDAWTVTVADDGTGFDSHKRLPDDRPHVGIQNVTQRLAAQCGGSLSISSVSGQGTTVCISIPKPGEIG